MVTKAPASTATFFGQNPAVLAALMLEQKDPKPSAIRGLGELCRQAGALEEARQLYDRLAEVAPEDAKARALAEILNGRSSPSSSAPDEIWPTPFVRLLDFFPAHVHADVQAMTAEALPQFVASSVRLHGHGMIDLTARTSSVLPNPKPYSSRFRPYVEAAVDDYDVAGALGIDRSKLQRYDMQVTCHGDGAFFKAHTDVDKEYVRHRIISYVYYFHRAPKRFTGGGLRLFDAAIGAGRVAQHTFTRIEPTDNSIVFFPSSAPHEVERVAVESGAMADGRFSLNGWILEAEAEA